jgi:hypothetical protein
LAKNFFAKNAKGYCIPPIREQLRRSGIERVCIPVSAHCCVQAVL